MSLVYLLLAGELLFLLPREILIDILLYVSPQDLVGEQKFFFFGWGNCVINSDSSTPSFYVNITYCLM
jgi:hypothetical protein